MAEVFVVGYLLLVHGPFQGNEGRQYTQYMTPGVLLAVQRSLMPPMAEVAWRFSGSYG
ncbi:hypothetical protein [Nonomuraea sp. NPDC050643]|uniref:hypothetical protein n=1 Tax=Nonomuraea sp. NPDC050643 TaxID=3155660 RepID=UPI0033C20E60